MFREMATFVFFVMTGYKFRPASNNPYFSVPTDDDMDEFGMGEVLIGGTAISEQERVTNDKIGCAIGFCELFSESFICFIEPILCVYYILRIGVLTL